MNDLWRNYVLFELLDQCSFAEALDKASKYFDQQAIFYGHGTDNSWDESVALLLWAAQLPIDTDPAILSEQVPSDALARFSEAINRRVNERIPAAYITNEAWFFGLPFYVNESVLVPRSPIAELIGNNYSPWLKKTPDRILDLCCGSGCIGIAAAIAQPKVDVLVSDISSKAIDIANRNIQSHQCADRVQAVCANLFDGVKNQQFDLILCNPPYVDVSDLNSMPAEYHHEPEIGLGSGSNGLDLTHQILAHAAQHLRDEGVLILEVGNSWVHLEEAYPNVPFIWLEFQQGGQGVCVLSKQDLVHYGF